LSTDSVEEELVRIVREELLLGSEREVPLDVPLGELGVGLDSLALVSLLTRIEAVFAVELPDDVWTRRGPLSLAGLAELVAASTPADTPASTDSLPEEILQGRMERAEYALRRYGAPGRAAWAAIRLAAPAKRFLFTRERNVILERRLDGDAVPVRAPESVVLRPFEPGDEYRLTGLWAPFNEPRGRQGLREWLQRGATALVAVEGEDVVALDVVADDGDEEVRVARPHACYGVYLAEAPGARGRGIGLALVAYSFEHAREHGFRTQLTYVRDDNTPMLAAATQLLGFEVIGSGLRTHVAGVTRWSWQIDGQRGRGSALVL
jgi:ribosomal protein S18 acetylase RimI-like enzyme/acyl carrier protein